MSESLRPAPPSPCVTRSGLAGDIRALGLQPGRAVMLHASVGALGWVVGGPDTVIQAVLDVLGPAGTLLMFTGWEDDTFALDTWDEARRQAYLREKPPFEAGRSRADRHNSILAEYLRTWPGACRSDHPEASVAAVGRLAVDLTRDHPHDYAYGPGSPLARLVDAGGASLVLGAPLSRITVLHLAEATARLEGKRVVRYRMPVLRAGVRTWETFEDYDTTQRLVAGAPPDYFGLIARAFLEAGQGREGRAGAAPACLLDARDLVAFGAAWMERHLAGDGRPNPQAP
ncbi:aminoglycoside 3-N-acetyltransferase [Mesoterricola sediminis]|uniref:Aminoglycoside N(3)-acetyltransferase n=1 Tax=Mesoterricola sediminis TaxID=2927980 RepID=A0AA48KFV0_9BACT|nr:aminoglycoside 3-N-acetyltransferase [Mesoterricola sediminis]BDU78667.1 AAC(3) family N-acetyltransferase [Mesoterricola sediminis]